MPGVLVTFTVTGGGGTITGNSVTTNASGVATVGGWTLGTVAGSNSVIASTSGLTPVTFIAEGVVCAPGSAGGTGSITSVLLPSLGGAVSAAHAINESGVVVGSSTDNTGMRAVRWTPMPGGSWSIVAIGGPGSVAVAVNARGDAVGQVFGGSGKLWPAAGGEIDLGPGEPQGINSAETVVGRLPVGSPLFYRALVWKKPSGGWLPLPSVNPSQDLPAVAGDGSFAQAITDLGVIVGTIGSSASRAVRWEPSGDQWTQPIAYPGTSAFRNTVGFAINSANDIAGYVGKSQGGGLFPMFLQSCGVVTNLESVGAHTGRAHGVNNAQRVVGFHDTDDGRRAFVWWPGASVQQLGAPPGYTADEAFGINNRSPAQAVGYGRDSPDRLRAIVWTIP